MSKDVRKINLDDFHAISSKEEKIKFLLKFAILAPSTHNSQPWLFKIKNNSCEILYDPKLSIPNADPEGRDLFISIGCAIENLILVSRYFGVFDSLSYRLSSNSNLVAEVGFKNLDTVDSQVNPNLERLVRMILARINARGIFLDKPIPLDTLAALSAVLNHEREEYDLDHLSIDFIKEKEKIIGLAKLTGEGIEIAYESKNFRKEMSNWFRNSFTFKKDGLPGYALKMPALVSLFFSTLVRFVNIGKKLASLNVKSISSAPLVCIISANQDEKPLIWVKTGRLAQRLMLEFNIIDYNTSIFVASIEMGETYKKVQYLTGITKRPQFFFVTGKIDSLHKPTPRFAVDERIVKNL